MGKTDVTNVMSKKLNMYFTDTLRVTSIIFICLICPYANSQTSNQARTDCFKTKIATEKLMYCGIALQNTSGIDSKTLEKLYLRRGNAFAELARFSEAINDFTSLIKISPRIAGYYDNRQSAYRELGIFNEALSDANIAIQIAPQYSFVYRSRGLTYEAMKQYGLAINDFDTAIFINPSDIGLIIDRARIKAKSGKTGEAISELSNVIQLDQSNPYAYKERGIAYFFDKNFRAAERDLLIASQSIPNDNDIKNALASITAQLGAEVKPGLPQKVPNSSSKSSSGSAFRITYGLFVTNHHVIEECSTMKVAGKQGGTLLASDPINDLALISAPNDNGEIANIRTTRAQLNETVTAAGFPLEGIFSGIAITNGTISRLSGLKGDTGQLQISAPVQPGNSGGPLLDSAGNVIGVVSGKLNAVKVAGATGDIPQNINFAIGGNTLRAFLDAKGVNYKEVGRESDLRGEQIAQRASGFTVLVECR